ncbi:GNAT family N-acetyltransferase [Nocardioides massiliensis]|uniref:GNAT family N-acetyltransferase n=1 Tax=Nocardioides massiliensis TaxID=1325935 RepID=UPI0034CD9008
MSRTLSQAGLSWLGAVDGGPTRLVGALAWDENADEVDIDRLVVDSAVHRRGAGSALVRAALSHSTQPFTTASAVPRSTPKCPAARRARPRR